MPHPWGKRLTDSLFPCAYRVIGGATGNERLREEGQLDKAKGDLYKTAGDVKDAVKKATGWSSASLCLAARYSTKEVPTCSSVLH